MSTQSLHNFIQMTQPNTFNDTRYTQLTQWLAAHPNQIIPDLSTLTPASSDASFRRYFRVQAQINGQAHELIVMDAPPPHEDCRPFVNIAKRLHHRELRVPQILAEELNQGFLILSDLGKQTYYEALHTSLDSVTIHHMYMDALRSLCVMQTTPTEGLPEYTYERLYDELQLFPEWYVKQHHHYELSESQTKQLTECFELLASFNAEQAQVFVHRDFHSPNLMMSSTDQPGILDFQDAVKGPITYDIASILMDARFTWDEEQQLDWAIRYWEIAKKAGLPVSSDFVEFHQAYEWMGLQRNLRILGVFARLNLRDNKTSYLQHIPRVNQYVRQVAGRYEAFNPLIKLLDTLDQTEYGFSF